MTRYGIWVDELGQWSGWVGFAAGGAFVPLAFDLEEAEWRARVYKENRPSALVSLRSDPPEEIPWQEAQNFATDGWKQVQRPH